MVLARAPVPARRQLLRPPGTDVRSRLRTELDFALLVFSCRHVGNLGQSGGRRLASCAPLATINDFESEFRPTLACAAVATAITSDANSHRIERRGGFVAKN